MRETMDRNTIDHYRKKLDELRRGLMAAYARNRDHGRESGDGSPQDFADKAASACNRDLVFSLSDTERSMLTEIREAAERMHSDQYGTCMECEEPISPRRLDAVPWARLCVFCQQRAERGIPEAVAC